MSKQQTVPDVLKKYAAQQGFASDNAFAKDLKVSRQSIHQWKNGIHAPDVTWLRLHALVHRGTWKGQMCTELLGVLGVPVETEVR